MSAPSTDQLREWARAAKSPAHALWGKAMPSERGPPMHSALAHMLDVAAVALVLVRERLPASLRARLLEPWRDRLHGAASLAFVVALHDLGKLSPAFQAKVPAFVPVLRELSFDVPVAMRETDHATLGVHLAAEALVRALGLQDDVAWRLARAVCAHHGSFPPDHRADDRNFGPVDVGGERWRSARVVVVDELGAALQPCPPAVSEVSNAWLMLLAGLTTFADWIGSRVDSFPYAPPIAEAGEYFEASVRRAAEALTLIGAHRPLPRQARRFEELFGFEGSPLQRLIEKEAARLREPALIVVEAPMGEGKTEAALILSETAERVTGHAGLFIGLPTQATANQIFGRVLRFLESTRASEISNLHLVHGEASINDRYRALRAGAIYDADGRGAVRAESWFAHSKRALLSSFGVGTVDQALLGVLRTKHGHLRLFGLAGKTVVLDEVHAYDAYTSELIERLVSWLAKLGSTIVLLSATLPRARRASLARAYGSPARDETPYPRVSITTRDDTRTLSFAPRSASRSVRLVFAEEAEEALGHAVEAAARGACVGYICNTVRRSQDVFRATRDRVRCERLLVHARFPRDERERQEQRLEARLGARGERPAGMLVVGTQVLEQSLDIDFDLLVSDVAPVDLLLQRAGRLHRHPRTRPAGSETPTVIVVRPQGSAMEAPLREVAGVYEEYVMRRTLIALDGRTQICLPDDIDLLVAEVYDDETTEALAALRSEFEARKRADRNNARDRELPLPTSSDDPFADLGLPFEDDDPSVHESLRALTRLGDPSIDAVCLEARGGQVFAGGTAVDLERPPDFGAVLAMLRRTVNIAHRGVMRALLAEEAPRVWAANASLYWKRPIVFHGGVAIVGDQRVTLDAELGLLIERDWG